MSSSSSMFDPRPATSDRAYSMGSRTGPPPGIFTNARNFSRPGPTSSSNGNKQAGAGSEEAQIALGRSSLDAPRRGMKRAETVCSKVSKYPPTYLAS
jgi:hypothetical protein